MKEKVLISRISLGSLYQLALELKALKKAMVTIAYSLPSEAFRVVDPDSIDWDAIDTDNAMKEVEKALGLERRP